MALLAWVGPVLVPPAAQAAPGDNYAVDDVFTAARTRAYRDDRFGMFMHFGLYSAFRGEYRRPDGTV
ncbi:hypothetical protein [Actinophytocola oryzae]|uniref:hypothetical protein n=1 Tax=Actinophytocola oryzae TaxID=502181 RepID=UPI001062617C|nr:hypothetical protein [Actinophytocola oryzae]